MTTYTERLPRNNCRQNARIMALMYPELAQVDGYVVFTDHDGKEYRVEHAWNETADGRIADSTAWAFAGTLPYRYERDPAAWARLAMPRPPPENGKEHAPILTSQLLRQLAQKFRLAKELLRSRPNGQWDSRLRGPLSAWLPSITRRRLDGKNAAVKATRPDGSGTFEAVAWDVLAQMQSRQIIRADGEFWIPGPGLKTGEYIEVIRARDDKRHGLKFPADGTTVWEKAEREALSRESYAEHEISSLASQLQPDGRGLRPVDHAHVAGLRKSQETLGQLYPVLVDKNGRVLDGKHRKAADPGWREVTIEKVLGRAVDDDTALAVAAVANSGRPWPKALQARVEQLLGAPRPKRDAVRDRIRAELLEDHERPDKTLAKIVGCSDMTVRAERLDLEGKSQIGIFRQGRGRPRTDGTPPRRQDTTPEHADSLRTREVTP